MVKEQSLPYTDNIAKIKILPVTPTIKKIVLFNKTNNLLNNYEFLNYNNIFNRIYHCIDSSIIDTALYSLIDESFDLIDAINYIESSNDFSDTESQLLEQTILNIKDEFLTLCRKILNISEFILLTNYLIINIDSSRIILVKRNIAKEFLL